MTPHHFVRLSKIIACTPYIAGANGRKIDAIGKIGAHDRGVFIVRGIDRRSEVFHNGPWCFVL